MAKRDKAKHPALEKRYNLKSRQELLDFDYLEDLSDSEADFLNDFVAETVNTNFLHDSELKRLNDIKSEMLKCEQVDEMNKRIAKLRDVLADNDPSEPLTDDMRASIRSSISELDKKVTRLKRANKNAKIDLLKIIETQIQNRRNEVLLFPNKNQHREFYTENNKRNSDLYNKASRTGTLLQLEPEEYDSYFVNSRNVDYEASRIDKMENVELEEKEADVYPILVNKAKEGCTDSKRFIAKLDDKKTTHEELFFLLEDIEEFLG